MFRHIDFKIINIVGYILFVALPLTFFVLSWQRSQIDFRNKASEVEQIIEVEDEESCIPDCVDKECGDDGCGGFCGECDEIEFCNQEKFCQVYEAEGLDLDLFDEETYLLEKEIEDSETSIDESIQVEDELAKDIAFSVDMNNDGKVNIEDLRLFVYYFKTGNRRADLNNNSLAFQDEEDLEIFISSYLEAINY